MLFTFLWKIFFERNVECVDVLFFLIFIDVSFCFVFFVLPTVVPCKGKTAFPLKLRIKLKETDLNVITCGNISRSSGNEYKQSDFLTTLSIQIRN